MIEVFKFFVTLVSEVKFQGAAAVDLNQVLHPCEFLLVLEIDDHCMCGRY